MCGSVGVNNIARWERPGLLVSDTLGTWKARWRASVYPIGILPPFDGTLPSIKPKLNGLGDSSFSTPNAYGENFKQRTELSACFVRDYYSNQLLSMCHWVLSNADIYFDFYMYIANFKVLSRKFPVDIIPESSHGVPGSTNNKMPERLNLMCQVKLFWTIIRNKASIMSRWNSGISYEDSAI